MVKDTCACEEERMLRLEGCGLYALYSGHDTQASAGCTLAVCLPKQLQLATWWQMRPHAVMVATCRLQTCQKGAVNHDSLSSKQRIPLLIQPMS